MQNAYAVENEWDTAAQHASGGEVIGVSLIRGEGLGVTMVVMCSSDADDALGEYGARAAGSACLGAEMDHGNQGAI